MTKHKKGSDAIPELIWTPLAGVFLTLTPGLIGLAAGNPRLFPSLGPTAFLQPDNPQQLSSRFYNTLVGHLLGIATGVIALLILKDSYNDLRYSTKSRFSCSLRLSRLKSL